MEPAFVDLGNYDIDNQSIGSMISGFGGFDENITSLLVGSLLGVMLIQWAVSSKDFTRSFDNILAGIVVAGVVVAAWWVTAGEMGVELLDEVEMMDERPFAAFSSWKDFLSHIVGGFLMGVGGVLAMGCTIGQAVTGASTLALGSFITFAAIVFGSALTMKIQYYGMVYEEESNFFKALVASLADMHLLPNSMRQLEKV